MAKREQTTFAGRLTALRQAVGITKYALAKRAGLTRQAISHLEAGQREPTWVTVQRLALALEAPFKDLADPALMLPGSGDRSRAAAREGFSTARTA